MRRKGTPRKRDGDETFHRKWKDADHGRRQTTSTGKAASSLLKAISSRQEGNSTGNSIGFRKGTHDSFVMISFLLLSTLILSVDTRFALALQLSQRTPVEHANGSVIGRRQWLEQGIVSVGIATTTSGFCLTSKSKPAFAQELPSSSEREALLKAIQSKASDDTVLNYIEKLIATQPQQSGKSLTDRIDGKWKLIWSIKDDKFSPLLQLPPPLRPTSYQLAGSAATPIVGEGRIAQLLTDGILGPTKTWLSSGIVEDDPNTLRIRPPFRLEVESPLVAGRKTLVDADSDADFRAVNVRNVEAQQAPPNLYQQLYLEDAGPGSLRISKIIKGDPVIVGATFVHTKM